VNCTVLQRRLLSCEQPDQPDADLKSHLARCPSCLAWHRSLVRMERSIYLLSVPPSTAKEEFVQRFLSSRSPRPPIADPSTLWRTTLSSGPKERGLRKVAVAFALAASLLVFALAWWSWPHPPYAKPDLVRLEQVRLQARLEERLANSLQRDTPKERVLRLAKLAEEVHGEARELVDHSERLKQWAEFYTRVVGEHLLEQARQLPPEDRLAVVESVSLSLRETESRASRFASQLQDSAPHSAASFRRIALASRKGEQDLRALMNG
jgi:hypothetical protein